jgi:hypothetical protein
MGSSRRALILVLESCSDAPQILVRFVEHFDLEVSEIALKSFPHRRHWHVRSSGLSGTIEFSWDMLSFEFWVDVRANRGADWICEIWPQISPFFEK